MNIKLKFYAPSHHSTLHSQSSSFGCEVLRLFVKQQVLRIAILSLALSEFECYEYHVIISTQNYNYTHHHITPHSIHKAHHLDVKC
jgi:hypothetical protein